MTVNPTTGSVGVARIQPPAPISDQQVATTQRPSSLRPEVLAGRTRRAPARAPGAHPGHRPAAAQAPPGGHRVTLDRTTIGLLVAFAVVAATLVAAAVAPSTPLVQAIVVGVAFGALVGLYPVLLASALREDEPGARQ